MTNTPSSIKKFPDGEGADMAVEAGAKSPPVGEADCFMHIDPFGKGKQPHMPNKEAQPEVMRHLEELK